MYESSGVAVHRRNYEKCGTTRLVPRGGGIHSACLSSRTPAFGTLFFWEGHGHRDVEKETDFVLG
eukprot:5480999-Pyramimonas_sp.AAC.1